MADRTAIEWTDATWNPIRGCTRVSEGCRNCYAEVMAARFSDAGQWGHGLAQRVALPGGGTDHRWTGKVELVESALDKPLRWRTPRFIFVNSTSDLFHEAVPDGWLDRIFAVMALAPQHTFQVLTKRPDRARAYLSSDATLGRLIAHLAGVARESGLQLTTQHVPDGLGGLMLPNVWLGTSVEDQATADARIPHLLATPAAVRFLSAEPLLGPLDLYNGDPDPRLGGHQATKTFIGDWWEPGDDLRSPSRHGLDWVICGGESGRDARPMHPDWARSLRDQCEAAEVPFFFKQWGEWLPVGNGDPRFDGPGFGQFDHCRVNRPYDPTHVWVGKKAAGRLLDGREWNQMPGGNDA